MTTQKIAPGGHWGQVVRQGETLKIVDLEGGQGVDFLCYNAHRTEERYHAPNTLKACRDLRLTTGHVLYSDDARALMTIVEDSTPGHDTIGGCCSEPSNLMLYGVANCPGCRENFLNALAPFDMGRRDIVPNINFFCDVPVDAKRRLSETVFSPSNTRAGDFVCLRAEMDVLAIISNCPQINNPCNGGQPTPIEIVVE